MTMSRVTSSMSSASSSKVALSGELGVEALDGGDGDLADGIDAAGAEHLDVVEVGELAAVVGGGELLEFVDGLAAEVAAVDEEEDALGTGVLDEAVGLGDGGEGLAGAGGHLDEGARAVGGEGFLEAGDGVDLAFAERGGDSSCGELARGGRGGWRAGLRCPAGRVRAGARECGRRRRGASGSRGRAGRGSWFRCRWIRR